jgi:hypothetical protein
MTFNEACKETKELYHEKIVKFLEDLFPSIRLDGPGFLKGAMITSDYSKYKAYDKIIKALAYEHLASKGFGGKERKIYSEQRQELLGITAKVKNIFIKKTGIYFAPSGGYDYFGEYDYDSGGLSNEKTHKILELDHWVSNGGICSTEWETNYIKIEACNVEKIHEGDSQNADN